jgi:hypothetical protein
LVLRRLEQRYGPAAPKLFRLVVAKLDRLARNVAFISRLMESGVEFVAADMPFANNPRTTRSRWLLMRSSSIVMTFVQGTQCILGLCERFWTSSGRAEPSGY